MYRLQDATSYTPTYYHVHMAFQKLKEIAQFPFGFLDFFFLNYFWFYMFLRCVFILCKDHIFGNFNLSFIFYFWLFFCFESTLPGINVFVFFFSIQLLE